jgi:hypothetical protein
MPTLSFTHTSYLIPVFVAAAAAAHNYFAAALFSRIPAENRSKRPN